MAHIIVVGAGQAGIALAAKLRALGYKDPLTLIGSEPHLPYQRPPLSKAYLSGNLAQARLHIKPDSFYTDANISLILGKGAAALDRGAKSITLNDGTILHYDTLAITTGARARALPAKIGGALQNVFTLRAIADADALAPFFTQPTTQRRCVIIGGGYVGLEVAAISAQCGNDTTVIEQAPRILQRVAAEETAAYLRALHTRNGVKIHENTSIAALEGNDDGAVASVRLSDGREIAADFVLVGIGADAGCDFLKNAGIAAGNGIAVNSFGQSADSAIWAAGDCALFPYQGDNIRLESVQNAIEQAENTAENIMGAQKQYAPLPWFWSDQYDVKLQIAGLNKGYDSVVARTNAPEGGASFWYYKGDRLLAIDALNAAKAYMIGKRILSAGGTLSPAKIADNSIDLKSLLR